MEHIVRRWKSANGHINASELRKAIYSLYGWGCCSLCILRFIGEKDPHIYRSLQHGDHCQFLNQLLDLLKETPDESKEDNNENLKLEENGGVCVACLGILQSEFNNMSFVNEISESVKSLQFEFKTFLCSISLPVNLLLRDRSLEILMREQHKEIYCTSNTDLKKSAVYVASAKDVWKWINGPLLASKLNVNFDQNSLFEIVLSFIHEKSDSECLFLADIYPDMFRRRKRQNGDVYTRANIIKALDNLSDDKFRKSYSCPPRKLDRSVRCEPLTCETKSLYFAGRYNKLSRCLSQTPWLVEGQRKTETSIEELISDPINKLVKASSSKFCASGREDVDVRMLGTGRPFAIEFVNPRRTTFSESDLKDLEREIMTLSNGEVSVRDLKLMSKEDLGVLKDGEEEKIKRYSALVWLERSTTLQQLNDLLTTLGEVQLAQKTPLRVLHRRPLATRPRTVHSIRVKHIIDEHHVVLSLSTQAGTYVKEFIHGDFGRTVPSLTSILQCQCDILQLDVECVELDWPK